MKREQSGFVWDLGTSTFSEVDADGFVGVQADLLGEPGADSFELHHTFGFASRPLDPDADGTGCNAWYAWEGQRGHAMLSHDPRLAKKIPPLKKGSSAQYCGKGGFGHFDGDDDTYTLYVPTDFDAGGTPTKAHVFTVGKDANGLRSITLLHADGMRITMLEGGKRSLVIANAPNNAWIEINDDGISLSGNVKISGNVGIGNEMKAWVADVVAKLTALGGAPTVPPPISLTA